MSRQQPWAGEISVRLGGRFSRNAVMGKIDRLDLPPRTTTVRNRPPSNPRVHKPPKVRVVKEKPPVVHIDPKLLTWPVWKALPGSSPVPLEQLTRSACRWPLSDSPFLFCALPVEGEGSPYCPVHSRRGRQSRPAA